MSAENEDKRWLDARLIDYTEQHLGEFTDIVTRFWELNGHDEDHARQSAFEVMGFNY
ncbi:MAG: hypothetical protein ACXWT5_13335 [Methylophilus sp.]